MPLPTIISGLNTASIYKSTKIYRDPITKSVIATLPPGSTISIIGQIGSWLGVFYNNTTFGVVDANEVCVEKDTMRVDLLVKTSTTTVRGPNEVFPAVGSVTAGMRITGFQRVNGFYRIGSEAWIKEANTKVIGQGPVQDQFPFIPLLIGAGATVVLISVLGIVKWNKNKLRFK